MLALETAQELVLSAIKPLPAETVLLTNAAGRVLAEDVAAPVDLPAFDQSSMDGFAVRAADLRGASWQSPRQLRCRARLAAGQIFSGELQPGECVPIATGAALPAGADAVVMVERSRMVQGNPDTVEFRGAVEPGENVRRRGDDVAAGTRVLATGQRLGFGALALLGALGLRQVRAARRPRVGLLATGSELVEPGQPLPPGAIYESNRVALAAVLAQAGACVRLWPIVPDRLEATRTSLEQALGDADVVVTTGGVSVGEWDLVKRVFEQLGGVLDFWQVAMRPGKPFAFGHWQDKWLFGLPGNPVSALVTAVLLVRPALLRMQGAADLALRSHPGVLAEPLANPGDRRHFFRVRVDDQGQVRSAGLQAAHGLRAVAEAHGLVDVPPGANWPAGSPVSVLRWDGGW